MPRPSLAPHLLGLAHMALERPVGGIIRPVGGAAVELVEGHDAEALVDEAGMGLAQIIAGKPRPAIDQEQHVGPVPKL